MLWYRLKEAALNYSVSARSLILQMTFCKTNYHSGVKKRLVAICDGGFCPWAITYLNIYGPQELEFQIAPESEEMTNFSKVPLNCLKSFR